MGGLRVVQTVRNCNVGVIPGAHGIGYGTGCTAASLLDFANLQPKTRRDRAESAEGAFVCVVFLGVEINEK